MTAPLTFEVEVDSHSVALEVEAAEVAVSPNVDPTVVFGVTPGPAGPIGQAGDGAQVFGEVPTGAMNGTNATFTTAQDAEAATVSVFLNGLRERFVTVTPPRTIVFDDPPLSTDYVSVDYIIG